MKKSLLALASLALVLAGCAKTEDISNLQSQINELKSDKIASIQSQITNINNSITSLQNEDKALKGFITTLQQQRDELVKADEKLAADIEQIGKDIDAAKADVLAQLNAYKTTVDGQIQSLNTAIDNLQKQDEALQKQINTLQTYVDNQLKDTRDWASATFASLEQYNTTAGIVATIQGQIETITAQIEALKKTVAGVTKKDLEDAISGLDTSLQAKISKVVDDCNAAISASEEKITAAYKDAISKAISDSETSMKAWINEQLTAYYTAAQTDAKISALKSDLEGKLASQKTYLEGLITGLQTTLTGKIDANKTLIDGLQSQVNQLSADLSTLAGKVATNSTNISNNAKTISDNATAISQNAGDIDACEKLIAANKKLIDENTAAINANDKDIADLQSRATADEKKIADNAAAIAKNAADIAKNAELIAANATAISNNAKAISDNAAAIVQLKADLAQAKKDITEAYTKAIGTAINELDGKLSGQIATEVATLNKRIDDEVAAINNAIDALKDRVTACEKDIKSIKQTIYGMQQDIEDLQEQVSAILARIQSISFVPKYSDGKAIMTYTDNGTITPGTAEFVFELQPAAAAEELAKVWKDAVSMRAVYTITKAAPETVELSVESVTADNEYITVMVSGKGLKDEYFRGERSASVRLKVSDGNNEKVSEYIQMIPRNIVVTGGYTDLRATSVTLFGWCNHEEEEGLSVDFGIEYSTTDLTTASLRERVYSKDTNNKFCCKIENIKPNTKYYYRTYSNIDKVYSFGDVETFTTPPIQASVTAELSDVKVVRTTISGKLTVNTEGSFTKSAMLYYSSTASTLDDLKSCGTKKTLMLEASGNYSILIDELERETKYYCVVVSKVDETEFASSVISFTTLKPSCPIGAVDLGLSVCWATCNIDATKPEEYGGYYQWAGTQDMSGKDFYYLLDNCPYNTTGDWKNWTKYIPIDKSSYWSGAGSPDNKTVLDISDDAAHVRLGGKWRMPTVEECEELIDNCTSVEKTLNEVYGRVFYSNKADYNGKSIFFPLSNHHFDSGMEFKSYWTSSLYTNSPNLAHVISFYQNGVSTSNSRRYDSLLIRPVSE